MRMPLPASEEELSFLHTNMRASFVAHLYTLAETPMPVVWGNGPKWESGPLPRMPEGEVTSPVCCFTVWEPAEDLWLQIVSPP